MSTCFSFVGNKCQVKVEVFMRKKSQRNVKQKLRKFDEIISLFILEDFLRSYRIIQGKHLGIVIGMSCCLSKIWQLELE